MYIFYFIFQERPLLHNTGEGVILTNRSLVLQGIDRTRSGGYTCQAINAVGSGQSQDIELDVKCKSNFILLTHYYSPAPFTVLRNSNKKCNFFEDTSFYNESEIGH